MVAGLCHLLSSSFSVWKENHTRHQLCSSWERTEQGRDVIEHWAAVVHCMMLPDLCTNTEGAGAATLKHWCGGLSALSFAVIFSSRMTVDSDCLVTAKMCSDVKSISGITEKLITFQVKDNLMLGCTQCFVSSILQEYPVHYSIQYTTGGQLLCRAHYYYFTM